MFLFFHLLSALLFGLHIFVTLSQMSYSLLIQCLCSLNFHLLLMYLLILLSFFLHLLLHSLLQHLNSLFLLLLLSDKLLMNSSLYHIRTKLYIVLFQYFQICIHLVHLFLFLIFHYFLLQIYLFYNHITLLSYHYKLFHLSFSFHLHFHQSMQYQILKFYFFLYY